MDDGDLDYRIHLSIDDWSEAEDFKIKGTYFLKFPDEPRCGTCEIIIQDGQSAWFRAIWNHGVQTSQQTWCPSCYSRTTYKSRWTRIKDWFRR